jgi:hypothetical protein
MTGIKELEYNIMILSGLPYPNKINEMNIVDALSQINDLEALQFSCFADENHENELTEIIEEFKYFLVKENLDSVYNDRDLTKTI